MSPADAGTRAYRLHPRYLSVTIFLFRDGRGTGQATTTADRRCSRRDRWEQCAAALRAAGLTPPPFVPGVRPARRGDS